MIEKQIDFDKMDGWEISNLLRRQPQLLEKCDTEKMNGADISILLQKQPQLKSLLKASTIAKQVVI